MDNTDKSRLLLDTILDAIPDIIGVQDAEHRILRFNKAGYRFLHKTPEEVVGKRCDEILGHKGRCLECATRIAIETKKPAHVIRYEAKIATWFDVRAYPILDETGAVVQIVKHARDITAEKEREERLALALDGAELGLWDCNLATNSAVYNERWAQMLGYELDEIDHSYEGLFTMIHPDDVDMVRDKIERHLAGETPRYEAEMRLRTKDGQWRWVLSKGRTMERDGDGNPLRVTGTHLDITDSKKAEQERWELEQQLLHTQKLESLGVLAGGVAHDFNNLLVAILGYADLSLQDPELPADHTRHIKEIERAARRAAGLCQQMLAYAGKGQFELEFVDLRSIVTEMANILRVSVSNNITLTMSFPDELPLIECDPSQARQIVMNLITNASEAIGNEIGSIRVSAGAKFFSKDEIEQSILGEGLDAGPYAWLEVCDSGCGMDLATCSKMFDPFFSTKFTGRGLGMAAVLGIIRSHRGTLTVETNPGQGSTIRILLPVTEGDTDRVPETTTRDAVSHQGTVLVVDDDETVREVARSMLEHVGFDVHTADGGAQAIELVEELGPKAIDCALLDMTMPKLNGREVFYALRRIDSAMAVVFSSGYNEDHVKAAIDGPEDLVFINKPYDLDALTKALDKAMKNLRNRNS